MSLTIKAHRIPPSRGFIALCNHKGSAVPVVDLKRWLRVNRLRFKTDKVDSLVEASGWGPLHDLLEEARELDIALSIRTKCHAGPLSLGALRDEGLHDVLLCPDELDSDETNEWLTSCRETGLPVRLHVTLPIGANVDIEVLTNRWAEHGVKVVRFGLDDPFGREARVARETDGRLELDLVHKWAELLEDSGIESTVLDVPFCLVDEAQRVRVSNAPQQKMDHQGYSGESLEFAERLYRRSPYAISRVLLIQLSRETFQQHPADNFLFPWLLKHEYAHLVTGIVRRLIRPLRLFTRTPRPIPPSKQRFEAESTETALALERRLPSVCMECSLRRICDHGKRTKEGVFTNLKLKTQSGDVIVDPLHYGIGQEKYYDDIDAARRDRFDAYEALAEHALRVMNDGPPNACLSPKDYGIEDAYFERYEGGVKWFSVSNVEKTSTPLARLTPPFTLAVDFGGGIADYVGFSLGRQCKLVCRMEGYKHSVALHVTKEGAYVLLLDGKPVYPMEFEGKYYLPPRLGDAVNPAISIWHIEDSITTSNIRIWQGEPDSAHMARPVRYSVLIVSTRFTRRLQAVMRCLAHQRDFDLHSLEVIVCYVPGVDATDDLLDSVSMTYPDLNIVRSPFPKRNIHSKGFLINESFSIARGDWSVLLDSDTLLPPNFFAEIAAAPKDAEFIAPDGRKLLTPETTAKILMGELDPWDEWQELLNGAGEYRPREAKGVPVGFCQCFRSKYLLEMPYMELENFEWADMDFGKKLLERAGPVHRLSGVPVLHLDHGSSQWYGTSRHL